jgi:Asp/Glu/hydantoin racemase
MTTRLTMIHTVGTLAPVFADLAAELVPDAEVSAVVDEDLLGETIAAGGIPDATAGRLRERVESALAAGSDLVLVTCSSVGPAVEALATLHDPRVLRVDEAMADRALELGRRIGVIATLSTTLEPTADLIRRRAQAGGARDVEILSHLCEGAFAALKSGDLERHDRLVREGLQRLLAAVDVIVLAQASMARVAATLAPEATAGRPILASPRLAMERVAERLDQLARAAPSGSPQPGD